jgi:hypothetical protein
LFLILLFVGASNSNAGSIDKGYQALEIQDYFKAKKYFTKGLKYNNSAASQGLAIIYFRSDNPFHNYDSAYQYVVQSIEGWDMAKESKKEKWVKYGFTRDSIFAFRQIISTEFFKMARSAKTESAYATFIQKHPWANEKSSAIATRDSIAFFAAVKINDTDSYKAFADKYPKSVYAELARENYYDSQFYEETTEGSLESYLGFIKSNPDSPLKPLAEKNVFGISTASNSSESFNNFIVSYPQNRFVDTAWVQLYEFELSDFSTEVMEKFLKTDVPFKSRIRKDIELFDSIALPYSVNSKYGFMNEDGKVMIRHAFDFVGFFQEGLAIVALNDKYGFINKHGDLQIPCRYESVGDFNNGLSIVELKGKMGMIDRNGRYLFECVYDDLGIFSEGMVYASLNDKYGYYDINGKEVISHKFDDAYDFRDGIANVESDGKQSIINQVGDYEIPLAYSEIKLYYDTLYTFEEDGFYGIMNHKAQLFVEPIYTAISAVHNGLAIASIQDRVVYLDTLGIMVIDNGYELYPNYILKGEFIDGVSIASKKGKYGRINLKDEVVTEFKFENIGMGTDQFPGQKEGLWGVFDSKGKVQVIPSYESLEPSENGNYIASRNDTMCVIDSQGNTIVPFSFSEVESIGNDLFLVKQNEKVGVYKNEKLIIPVQYDQIGVFDKDFLFLSKEGRLLYYNISNGELIELTDK